MVVSQIIQSLDRNYNDFKVNQNFHQFFYSIYKYIDFLEKIPEIQTVLEDQCETENKFESDINQNSTLSDDSKDFQIKRMGAFNFCGSYWRLYNNVYKPIYNFKNPLDLSPEFNYRACVMLGMKLPPKKILVDRAIFGWVVGKHEILLEDHWKDFYTRRMKSYKIDMKRLHTALIDKITESELVNSYAKKEVSYDTGNAILRIDNKEVLIKRKNDLPNAHYILELMFKDPEDLKKPFYYSEIADDLLDTPLGDKGWRSLFRACADIQDKVRKVTKIEDFLIIKTGKTGSVQINSRYL